MTAPFSSSRNCEGPCVNTDREIYRERPDDYYADSIHVTEGGGIGINCGGMVYVKPLREWHRLAEQHEAGLTRSETEERNPEQRHSGGVAESQAPSIRDGEAGVTPGRPPVVPDSRSDKWQEAEDTLRAGLEHRDKPVSGEIAWEMCRHIRMDPGREGICEKCPALVKTNYGPGTQMCRTLAEDAYRTALSLAATASTELHAAIEGEELVWKVTPGRPPVVPDSETESVLAPENPTRWAAQYDFDKSDPATCLFVAASNWMDRAKHAEAVLREAFAFGLDLRHAKGCTWAAPASNFQKHTACSCGRDKLASKLNAVAFKGGNRG